MTCLRMIVAAFFLMWWTGTAQAALLCTGSMSDILFGTVSLRSGSVNETSGTLEINCTGIVGGAAGICVRFGAGSGGAAPQNSPRYLRRSDGAALAFNLRAGGNGVAFPIWEDIYVPLTRSGLLGVNGRAVVSVFADIIGGLDVGTGTYVSSFPVGIVLVSVGNCNGISVSLNLSSFTVSATVAASCDVSAGSLAFGNLNPTSAIATDANGSFVVRCSTQVPYAVRLGTGNGLGATGPTDRRLSSGVWQLRYGLYSDAARTQVWGDTAATDVNAIGNGFDQVHIVYGRIFGNQPYRAGNYADSVLITIEY